MHPEFIKKDHAPTSFILVNPFYHTGVRVAQVQAGLPPPAAPENESSSKSKFLDLSFITHNDFNILLIDNDPFRHSVNEQKDCY
jgi:hypothetical protein